MSPDPLAHNDAILALALLRADGVITSYVTNFGSLEEPGVKPLVIATILAKDELALERTARRVRVVVRPYFPDVQVTIVPERALRTE